MNPELIELLVFPLQGKPHIVTTSVVNYVSKCKRLLCKDAQQIDIIHKGAIIDSVTLEILQSRGEL